MNNKELIKDIIYTNPIALLAFKDKEDVDFINSFLPYSTGFEIECNYSKTHNWKNYQIIPDIINYNSYSPNLPSESNTEERFRIPNGLQGLICLFNICQELPHNNTLNEGSGIHYHIDCIDVFNIINTNKWIDENNNWIIERLKEWETAKKIDSNAKVSQSRGWVRIADNHKTIEFRIGEMTFDYNLILKRILDCQDIVRRIKKQIFSAKQIIYNKIDSDKIFNYLQLNKLPASLKSYELLKQELDKQQKELQQQSIIINPDIDMKKVITSRVKKFV